MQLPTAHELRTTIESAGWQIKSWSDVRAGTERTQHGYRLRLKGAAVRADGDTQLSLLKQLTQHCTNVSAAWQVRCHSTKLNGVPTTGRRPACPCVRSMQRPPFWCSSLICGCASTKEVEPRGERRHRGHPCIGK